MNTSLKAPRQQGETAGAAAAQAGVRTHPLQRQVDSSPRQQGQRRQLAQLKSGEPPIQRAKTEEERGKKHQRVQRATETIARLGGNLKPGLANHIFNAQPVGGGALNAAAPSGLHAYTDGELPASVTKVRVAGNPGGIHKLTWKAAQGANAVEKDSTMFPIWMPPAHVATLIGLKHPEVGQNDFSAEPLHPAETKTYIQHGQNVYERIRKVGDTVYPQ